MRLQEAQEQGYYQLRHSLSRQIYFAMSQEQPFPRFRWFGHHQKWITEGNDLQVRNL